MQHFRTLKGVQLNHAWLTIGSFDGVHIGHQEILKKLTAGAHAEEAPAVVLTFDPHPIEVLRPDKSPRYLTFPAEKAVLIGRLGVDVVITHPFNEQVASYSAEEFLRKLNRHLGLRQFWVGYDFAMGKDRSGDISRLRNLGEKLAYELQVIEAVHTNGDTVSSSLIRSLLQNGELEKANRYLGRHYQLEGKIVQGAQRGRTIGIPTANLDFSPKRLVPQPGVYVCKAVLGDKSWQAVTNIGVRPTFENGQVDTTVEAHLLDFSDDIYGENMQLQFIHRLRGEKKFSGVDALVQQIRDDIAQSRRYLDGQAKS